MLRADEIESVVLGAQLVAGLADPLVAHSAQDVTAKITSVVPEHLRPFIVEPSVAAKPPDAPHACEIDTRPLKSAIREGLKLRLRYGAGAGDPTERTVWPVVLGYADSDSLLIDWCERRRGFRHSRTERILDVAVLDERYAGRRSDLRRRWERWRETEHSVAVRASPASSR